MSEKKDTGEIVDLTERVTVWPTEKAPYHAEEYAAGVSIQVAPKVADKMKKYGWATDAKPAGTGKGKKQVDDLI